MGLHSLVCSGEILDGANGSDLNKSNVRRSLANEHGIRVLKIDKKNGFDPHLLLKCAGPAWPLVGPTEPVGQLPKGSSDGLEKYHGSVGLEGLSGLAIKVHSFDTFHDLYHDDPDLRTIFSSFATTPFRDSSKQNGYIFKGCRVFHVAKTQHTNADLYTPFPVPMTP
ncbi:hypothetical protein Tco_1547068 [Tanacetum coccineum]